ncbi:glutaredoxin domain-containing protein [Tessaracoccus massiliensis]|uniref:glutaredoxin domain-containing protein n=1 Tax=Tessaracoccus massiliensis TaxID=1522311 RepID=UPI001C5A3250|nr:glutaredoxin domain-containing protein [Tessaracoccus massiliensis]
MQRWVWVVVLVFGLLAAGSLGGWQPTLPSILLGVSVVLLSWWMSPFSGGRTMKHTEVMSLPEGQRRVVIYWRPGCIFCQRLKGGLGSDGGKATWINIWHDEDAAAFVRSVNDGNEVVPTVVIDGQPHTNPAPQLVLDALS